MPTNNGARTKLGYDTFEQFDTLKYSSIPKAEVIRFLALGLYLILLLSSSVHLSLGFSVVVLMLASNMVGM